MKKLFKTLFLLVLLSGCEGGTHIVELPPEIIEEETLEKLLKDKSTISFDVSYDFVPIHPSPVFSKLLERLVERKCFRLQDSYPQLYSEFFSGWNYRPDSSSLPYGEALRIEVRKKRVGELYRIKTEKTLTKTVSRYEGKPRGMALATIMSAGLYPLLMDKKKLERDVFGEDKEVDSTFNTKIVSVEALGRTGIEYSDISQILFFNIEIKTDLTNIEYGDILKSDYFIERNIYIPMCIFYLDAIEDLRKKNPERSIKELFSMLGSIKEIKVKLLPVEENTKNSLTIPLSSSSWPGYLAGILEEAPKSAKRAAEVEEAKRVTALKIRKEAELQAEREKARRVAIRAEADRQLKLERERKLLKIKTQPKSLSEAEKTALSTPFSVSLVPQMNDLMLCVQGKFRSNITLTAEISKRGIRCNKLLELMR